MKVIEIKRKLDPNAIKSLEYLLLKARAGELVEFCYVGKIKDKWFYKSSTPEEDNVRLSMIGMLDSVKQRLVLMLDWGKV